MVAPVVDAFSAIAAPFTGGLSLALPFALTGIEDIASGNFNNLPLQLAGDVATAIPGLGEFGGAAAGAAGGAAADAGFGFADLSGAFGGLGGAAAPTAADFASGVAGAAGGLASDTGFGFGDLSGAFGGLGDTAAPTAGDFSSLGGAAPGAGVGAMPTALPPSTLQTSVPDVVPAGGGGSAITNADPFGTGMGGNVGSDVGTSEGGASAFLSTYGDPNAAATGGQQGVLDPNTFPSTSSIDYNVSGGPGGALSGTGPNAVADTGIFGGVKDFLKQNKDLISLGMGGLGVGRAIMNNNAQQEGMHLLEEQARQANMNLQEFNQSYQNLINQALPLIQAGGSGQLTPAQAQTIFQTANRMKQEIASKYAGLGQSGSTSMQQDLNNVDMVLAQLQNAMAMGTLNAGIQLAGGATGAGQLISGANSSIGQLAKYSMASNKDLTDALTGFAKAAGASA